MTCRDRVPAAGAPYGRGEFCDFLYLHTPFGTCEHNGIEWQHTYPPALPDPDSEEYPYPLHPAPGGLLIWGTTMDADRLCWLTEGAPEDWPVVVWSSGGRYETHRTGAAGFIAGWAGGRVDSELLGAMEPDLAPWFNTFRTRVDRCLILSEGPLAHPGHLAHRAHLASRGIAADPLHAGGRRPPVGRWAHRREPQLPGEGEALARPGKAAHRPDLPSSLPWTTPPLSGGLTFAGNIEIELDAAITEADTSWIAALEEIDFQGGAHCPAHPRRTPPPAHHRELGQPRRLGRLGRLGPLDRSTSNVPSPLRMHHVGLGATSVNTVHATSRLLLPVLAPPTEPASGCHPGQRDRRWAWCA